MDEVIKPGIYLWKYGHGNVNKHTSRMHLIEMFDNNRWKYINSKLNWKNESIKYCPKIDILFNVTKLHILFYENQN